VTAAHFVSYYRVSTDKQNRSGLGLEAQRAAVEAHVAGACGAVAAEFIEVESGRKRDRPQLAAALAAARVHRAVLVIAKLDRLARNVHFVSGLMESGVEFVAADMPTVNRLTVHILAAVAEEEARMISARTKAALAAAKARGIRLGNPGLVAGSAAQARVANAVKTERAQARAAEVLPFIEQAHQAGALTLQQLADALAARGVSTPSGRGSRWHPVQVARIVGSAHSGFRFRKAACSPAAEAPLPAFLETTENLEE
jgi:DNA invertase Pin-like site-specific DNA recombinase